MKLFCYKIVKLCILNISDAHFIHFPQHLFDFSGKYFIGNRGIGRTANCKGRIVKNACDASQPKNFVPTQYEPPHKITP